ncbi:hypothetical protein [Flavobacterium bizetiae]|uniref:hypothetical protein n=1 Tax=Flavobacterium bizetiae TaxID=2704140 RepID=UPI0037574AB1
MNIWKKDRIKKQMKEIIQSQQEERDSWIYHVAVLGLTVVKGIKEKGVSTVPEILLGYNKYPDFNSELDRKYKEVQAKLIIEGFATKGDNRLNGYSELSLTEYAYTVHDSFDYLRILAPERYNPKIKKTSKWFELIKENLIIQIITTIFALIVIYLAYYFGWKN